MKKNECVCGCVRKWHEDGMGMCVNHQPGEVEKKLECLGYAPRYPELQKKVTG